MCVVRMSVRENNPACKIRTVSPPFLSIVRLRIRKKEHSKTMATANDIVPPGVVTGENLLKLLTHAKDNGYAIPAFNCTS